MEFSHDAADALLNSADQFPVDFDSAWRWVGYSEKRAALKVLKNNFEEGFDFLDKGTKSTGGRSSQWICLTIDCFKSFCMMAGTEKGKEVRRYYLQIEKEAKQQKTLSAADFSTRLDRIEQAVVPDLPTQLASGNAHLCWILRQCALSILAYSAASIGVQHVFQQINGVLSVQWGMSSYIAYNLLCQRVGRV